MQRLRLRVVGKDIGLRQQAVTAGTTKVPNEKLEVDVCMYTIHAYIQQCDGEA